jgi:uncharacterized protein (UPF0332 family)
LDATPQLSWRLEKAQRFLLAAARAFEVDDWETAVSRAYYAVYHSMIALLEAKTELRIPRRHAQLHNLLRSPLVATIVSIQDASDVRRLYFVRQSADYDDVLLDRTLAEESLRKARILCQRIGEVM